MNEKGIFSRATQALSAVLGGHKVVTGLILIVVLGGILGMGAVATDTTTTAGTIIEVEVECPLMNGTWTPFPCYECPKNLEFSVPDDAECIVLLTHTAWVPSSNEPRNTNEVNVYVDGEPVFRRLTVWPETWGMIKEFYSPGIAREDLVGTVGTPDAIYIGHISAGDHTLRMVATEENYYQVDGVRIILLSITSSGHQYQPKTVSASFENGTWKNTRAVFEVPVTTATPTSTPTPTPPGFEAVFAIAGLLAVAYLVHRRKG